MSNTSITPTSNNNYQIFPLFTGTDSACTNAVYLLPPMFTYGQQIQFTIPQLYIGTGGGTYSNTDFQIQLISGQSVQITITGTNAWACAASARSALMSNFTDFLQNIETQFELTGMLVPGATFRIGQQIADWIPAPLGETLFYRYSVSSGFAMGTVPCVDVRPGMRLRVETQVSQYITAASPLNGYVGSGRFSFLVSSVPGGGSRVVAFDPFLGTIRTPAINPPIPSPAVAGGLLDLQSASAPQKYWRLFYPPSVPRSSQPGDLASNDNTTLVGAQTLAQLNAATASYPQSSPPSVSTIFLGRAIAIPEIPIWLTVQTPSGNVIQTVLEYIPIGTTLNNLIERFTVPPLNPRQLATIPPVSTPLASVSRITFATSTSAQSPLSMATVGGISWYTQSVASVTTAMLDLPLIAGDVVTLTV